MAILMVVWLAVSGYLFYGAAFQIASANAADDLLIPSAIALTSVMDERSATLAYLEEPDSHQDELRQARQTSDETMGEVLGKFQELFPLLVGSVQERVTELGDRFNSLPELRQRVDSGDADRAEVIDEYTAITHAGADLFEEQSREGRNPPSMGAGLSATSLFRTVDLLSLADARLSQSFATGKLTLKDQQEFTRLVGAYHGRLDVVTEQLGPEQAEQWRALSHSSAWAELTALEDEVVSRQPQPVSGQPFEEPEQDLSPPVSEEEWQAAFGPVKEQLTELGAGQAGYAGEITRGDAQQMLWMAILSSAGILAVFTLAFVFSRRTAQGVVQRLFQLRDATQELADQRLPDIVERLGHGSSVDISAELPELPQEEDEVGQVARSFNIAQRTAVEAAVRQAEVRHGVSRVFLNIAHRSQTLVRRQLRVLDKLEREQEDPDQLTDLFTLDHLATRSRRNAENLLILGGEALDRSRPRPMPLVDVLRAAISESGDYSRVARQRVARASLHGPAVPDVTHLVAELVDNATTFSPPATKVHVRSEEVGTGLIIEIEDRGIGMKEEEFTRTNALLADAPEFDVMRVQENMRLGLFVVSRLAHRHGIRVKLRSSPYGGVLAIVLLPVNLLAGDAPQALEEADNAPAPAPTPTPEAPPAAQAPVLVPPAETPPGASPATARPEPAGPARNANPASGTADTRPRLPRRKPQAHLAQQLHDDSENTQSTSARSSEPSPIGDPDRPAQVRSTLTAFQQGTARGRGSRRAPQSDENTGKDA